MTNKGIARRVAAVIVSAALIAAPGLAEAAAGSSRGGGMNAGSRGSQTYTTPQTAPGSTARPQAIERSATPAGPTSTAPGARTAGATAPGAQPGWAQRNPFLAGMAGGLIGAGIGAMLFGGGHGLGEAGGFAGMLGMLLQVLIFGGLAFLAFRVIRRLMGGNRAQPALATPDGTVMRTGDMQGYGPAAGGGGPAEAPLRPLAVEGADQEAFSRILIEVQAAWTGGDLNRMRGVATPEMVGYFADAMAENASAGIANRVETVTLLRGDIVESWSENGRDYVSATLTWSAVDTDVRVDQPATVVRGTLGQLTETTEMWTFVRGGGGRWLLSAIQQVR